VISVTILCIGLSGLIIYISESKTKETGIRKVNGAAKKIQSKFCAMNNSSEMKIYESEGKLDYIITSL
jgi:hypothetical protein